MPEQEIQNLAQSLRMSAGRFPKRKAIVFGSKTISYQELDEQSEALACGFLNLGIKPKERIALFLDNCPEFIIAYYAILKAGSTAVPINYMFKIEEEKFILDDSGAVAVITSRPYVSMQEELRLRLDALRHIITTVKVREGVPDFSVLKKSSGKTHLLPQIHPQDLAVILYTSGTTGFPKGAMLTHENLTTNAAASALAINSGPRDAFICILPLFHSFAATVCMNLPILVGAKIVVMKSLRPFKRVIRAIRKNRVTVFVGIPSLYAILKNLKLPKIFQSPLIKFFNPVKVCISGAAALPQEVFHGFEKKFRIPLLEGYGLTEASPVVTLNPLKGPRIAGSIGVSLAKDIELKIIDGHDRALEAGEIGELLVRGPNVMRGYYGKRDASEEVLKDSWLYTGDLAKSDPQGYFYIVGRKKEMINVRGLNVYPREIEEALYQNPKVKEAAVIGILDEHKGEVPKAFVVLKEGERLSEHELIQYLRERLAPYKVPKFVVLRESLPKNTTGKILKRILVSEEQKCERAK